MIKKFPRIIALLYAFSLVAAPLALFISKTASAACTTLPTTLGTVSFTINVPASNTYRFWAHIYSPSNGNDAFYMQVDQSYCQVTVGNTAISSGQFKWVDYQNGSTANKIDLTLSAGNHSFTLAGLDPSVGVDKIILAADSNCVPTGDGTNCTTSPSGTGTTPLPPVTTGGSSNASQTPTVTGNVALPGAADGGSVQYYLNGKLITGNSLDTTKLPDGKYDLKRVETDANGKTTEATQKIVVDNHQTLGERVSRFVHRPFVWISAATVTLLAVALFAIWRFKYHWLVRGKEWFGQTILRKSTNHTALQGQIVVFTSYNSQKHSWRKGLFILGFALAGAATALYALAATSNSVGYMTWNGSVANGASIATKANAIGGKMVQFAANAPVVVPPDPPPTTPPTSTNAFPDRWTVGAPGVAKYKQTDQSLPVPAGYTVINPSDAAAKVYNIYSCGNVTLDHVYIKAAIYLGTGCYGTVTIKNSIIAPPAGASLRAILNNTDGKQPLTLNISDTTVRPEPVPLGGRNDALTDHMTNGCGTACTVHINRVDASNIGGLCLCGENTTVENSWLHDLYITHMSDPSVAHTGGVFPYGGSGPLTIRYNRLEPGYNTATGTEVTNYWKAITAVLFTQGTGGTTLRNYQVYNNFISLGAYDIDLENGQGLVFHDNVFGPNHWGHTNSCFSNCPTFGDWSNNRIGDINGVPGAALAKPW